MVKDLDSAARARLHAAIAAAETQTSAEIVVVVTRQATDWSAPEVLTGALLALAAPSLLLPMASLSARDIWLVQIAVFALGWWLAARLFVLPRMMPARLGRLTRSAAIGQFAAHGLERTAGRSAVLLFVALRERRVEIVCDDAVDVVMPHADWAPIAATLAAELKAGRLEAGLTRAAAAVGTKLSGPFPARAVNPDELPNLMMD